ncbi:MAG: S1C family serine protease [Planctomycetaceae bacterium]
MPAPSRLVSRLAAACVAMVTAAPRADEGTVPLAPIEASAAEGRVDPMRPARLTAAERDRLYQEAARDAEHLEQQSRQLRRLARLLQPAVVHIDARKPALRPRGGKATEEEAGSGVITEIAGRTVVLTNRHVVDRAPLDTIVIRLDDDRELHPRRLWSDAGTDLAVMEIEAPDLVTARLADTGVEIGDTVLAIGSPFGLAHSLTLGIVSATGRRDLELGEGVVKFQDFIQSDAAINPGNSGGPLVNLRGEVVGINTCIASNSGGFEGLGFAIPVGMVRFVARQLVERGSVARGYLGVSLDRDFTQAEAQRLGMVRRVGARIDEVTAESPAAVAGMRRDDVVLEFDGRAVQDDDHLMSLVSTTPADSTVELVIFRDRRRLPLRITVASRASFEE